MILVRFLDFEVPIRPSRPTLEHDPEKLALGL
jgi:hypothetical protein